MKPYINPGNQQYDGRFPPFYDRRDCPEVIELLESQASVFLSEWDRYRDTLARQKSKFFLLYKETGWQTLMLYSYGLRYHRNCLRFPETTRIAEQIPGLVTAYFSTLQPGTKLTPHWGDTDVTYRIHLGLHIPEGLPECGIEVGGIQAGWEEGKTFIFNDAHFHTAWNLTGKPRTVFIVDVLRPEFYGRRWYIVPAILGAMGVGRVLFPLGLLKRMPRWATRVLHVLATLIFMMVLPVQRLLGMAYRKSGK